MGKVTALKLPARNDKKKNRKEIEQKSSFKNWEASERMQKKTIRANKQPAEYGRWLEGIIYTNYSSPSLSRHVASLILQKKASREFKKIWIARKSIGSVCQL